MLLYGVHFHEKKKSLFVYQFLWHTSQTYKWCLASAMNRIVLVITKEVEIHLENIHLYQDVKKVD